MSDNLIERLTRAAAEADGQVWHGLSSKHSYANMAGAILDELVKSGERTGAGQLAAEYRRQILQELIDNAKAECRQDPETGIRGERMPGEDPATYALRLKHAEGAAEWLKSQMESGE